jgi:hypothetical protein
MKSKESFRKLCLVTGACDVVLDSIWKERHQWSTIIEKREIWRWSIRRIPAFRVKKTKSFEIFR